MVDKELRRQMVAAALSGLCTALTRTDMECDRTANTMISQVAFNMGSQTAEMLSAVEEEEDEAKFGTYR